MNRILPTLAVAALLMAPAAASAHVTVQPTEVAAGSFTVLNVRVPNEKDDASTTEVRVQMPDGFISASYEPVPGWKVAIKKAKTDKPVTLEGIEIDEQVSEITFSGGKIGPGQFQDFPLSVKIPEGKAGDKLTFKALQTYSDGETVRWIGAADSDDPAPQVTLLAASGEGEDAAPADTAAPAAASTSGSADDGGDGLAIAALIVGALGLIAGVAGLMAARRARA